MSEALNKSKLLDIYCASCGAPAEFDIAAQRYCCAYCGAQTGIREALETKKRFRQLSRDRQNRTPSFRMFSSTCNSCGAEVVVQENEALTHCAFCGKNLVRQEYLKTDEFPELLIPFRLTPEQAKQALSDWCRKNARRPEARTLKKNLGELKGFYLPYQLVKGPTGCTVRRDDTERAYECRGYVDGMFVNTSNNLNNLVLNGMEPYDLSDLREFDFAFLAGQRVRMADCKGDEVVTRVGDEIAAEYQPFAARTMETRAVRLTPHTGGLLSMSVVLPAYYIRVGKVLAAVNGQTGKVAVQEQRDRFLLPWWLKPIAGTLLFAALAFALLWLPTQDLMMSGYVSGLLGIFLAVGLFTAYHNVYAGTPRWKLAKRILTSDKTRTELAEPVFYEEIDGEAWPVKIRFTTVGRTLLYAALTVGLVFFPVIIAFILNGFSAQGLTIGGAAVWLCIFVPLAPVFVLKFGRLELYNHPLIYVPTPRGGWKRVRRKLEVKKKTKSLFGTLEPVPLLIGLAVALVVLIIQVTLVLHWDEY